SSAFERDWYISRTSDTSTLTNWIIPRLSLPGGAKFVCRRPGFRESGSVLSARGSRAWDRFSAALSEAGAPLGGAAGRPRNCAISSVMPPHAEYQSSASECEGGHW